MNEVVPERALLAFHRSSLSASIPWWLCWVAWWDFVAAGAQGELLAGASLVEVAEANSFPREMSFVACIS
jgi:hypothetical protein